MGPDLGQTGQNQAQNCFFYHFLKFGLLVLLEVAYDSSLEQCLTTSGGKTHRYWGPSLGQNIVLKLGFSLFSQVCFISFPLSSLR